MENWIWLLLLACPLMMVFMMRGMGGHEHKHGSQNDDQHHGHENHTIHRELSELRAQNEQMRKEIQNLKQSR